MVVSYWESTSNHNYTERIEPLRTLYLIGNLHQTTTRNFLLVYLFRCILLGIYIKPQPIMCARAVDCGCILLGIYIKPQPLWIVSQRKVSCILLGIYIKPQRQI